LRALGEIELVFERKYIKGRHFDNHISTLHHWIGLPFGYIVHRYVGYILAGGIFNIMFCERDMVDGIFLEKTSFFLVAIARHFLLHQPLNGDAIWIYYSSKCSLKSER